MATVRLRGSRHNLERGQLCRGMAVKGVWPSVQGHSGPCARSGCSSFAAAAGGGGKCESVAFYGSASCCSSVEGFDQTIMARLLKHDTENKLGKLVYIDAQ